MTTFIVQNGKYDDAEFDLSEIRFDDFYVTPNSITINSGDTVYEVQGDGFRRTESGQLSDQGQISSIRTTSPDQSYITVLEEPFALAAFLQALERNATDELLDQSYAGDDFLFGADGNDVLAGRNGDDMLSGGAGNDKLLGGSNNDILFGNDGKDKLAGGSGSDNLYGAQGADELRGGKGKDALAGGSGDDDLQGGAGADQFFFDPSNKKEGNDKILDFEFIKDTGVFDALDIVEATTDKNFSKVRSAADIAAKMDKSDLWSLGENKGGEAVLVHPNGKVILKGVPAEELPFETFSELVEVGLLVIDTDDFLV